MFILVNYIDPSLIESIRDAQIDALKQTSQLFNYSENQLEELISAIKDTNPSGLAQIAVTIPVSFYFRVLSLLLSLQLSWKETDQINQIPHLRTKIMTIFKILIFIKSISSWLIYLLSFHFLMKKNRWLNFMTGSSVSWKTWVYLWNHFYRWWQQG